MDVKKSIRIVLSESFNDRNIDKISIFQLSCMEERNKKSINKPIEFLSPNRFKNLVDYNRDEVNYVNKMMVIKTNPVKLSRITLKKYLVVHYFGRAKTQCMKVYIKPAVNLPPNQVLIHCGTSNLPSNIESEDTAKGY